MKLLHLRIKKKKKEKILGFSGRVGAIVYFSIAHVGSTNGIVHSCPFHLSCSFLWVAIISWTTLTWSVSHAGEFLNICCILVRWNPVLCYSFRPGSNFSAVVLPSSFSFSVTQLQSSLGLVSAVWNEEALGCWNVSCLLRKLIQKIT